MPVITLQQIYIHALQVVLIHTLDIQYSIFSWTTNFPYLLPQTRNPTVNVVLLGELAILNDSL